MPPGAAAAVAAARRKSSSPKKKTGPAAVKIDERACVDKLLQDRILLCSTALVVGLMWVDMHLPAWFTDAFSQLSDGVQGIIVAAQFGGAIAAFHFVREARAIQLRGKSFWGAAHDGWRQLVEDDEKMPSVDIDPTAVIVELSSAARGDTSALAPDDAALPDGWVESADASGRPLYRNVHTQETSPTRPAPPATRLLLGLAHAGEPVSLEERAHHLEEKMAALSAAVADLSEKAGSSAATSVPAAARIGERTAREAHALPPPSRLPPPARNAAAPREALVEAATSEISRARELLKAAAWAVRPEEYKL